MQVQLKYLNKLVYYFCSLHLSLKGVWCTRHSNQHTRNIIVKIVINFQQNVGEERIPFGVCGNREEFKCRGPDNSKATAGILNVGNVLEKDT